VHNDRCLVHVLTDVSCMCTTPASSQYPRHDSCIAHACIYMRACLCVSVSMRHAVEHERGKVHGACVMRHADAQRVPLFNTRLSSTHALIVLQACSRKKTRNVNAHKRSAKTRAYIELGKNVPAVATKRSSACPPLPPHVLYVNHASRGIRSHHAGGSWYICGNES
jgi:hypothetical protein